LLNFSRIIPIFLEGLTTSDSQLFFRGLDLPFRVSGKAVNFSKTLAQVESPPSFLP
jgi:hypothetical protein